MLLEHIRAENAQIEAERKLSRQGLRPIKKNRSDIMHDELLSPESLKVAWERISKKTDARLLFDEAGFSLIVLRSSMKHCGLRQKCEALFKK